MESNLDGVKLVEATICLDDYTKNESLLSGWMEHFKLSQKNTLRSGGENFSIESYIQGLADDGHIPSVLHGYFLETFLEILPPSESGQNKVVNQYNTAFNTSSGPVSSDENNPLESWVTELVQNAIDLKAKEIDLVVEQNGLRFYHDGGTGEQLFSLRQLSALFSVFDSTKVGDFSKIGKFGIGFKYWWRHFQDLEIRCVIILEGSREMLSIKINRDFDPRKSFIEFSSTPDESDVVGTHFHFSNPLEPGEWATGFMNLGGNNPLVADRLYQSLPFIQLKVGDEFSMNVQILESPSSRFFCRVESQIEHNHALIEHVLYGREGENPSAEALYRISTNIGTFRTILPDKFERFKNLVLQEYRKSTKYGGHESGNEFMQNIVNQAFASTSLSNLYNPSKEHGMLSNLFVANHHDSFISAPFIAEAPWLLHPDRVRLDMDRGDEWNKILAHFVDQLHAYFVQVLIEDENNLGYLPTEICKIVNTPLGTKNKFEILEEKWHHTAGGEERLTLESYPNVLFNRSEATSLCSSVLSINEEMYQAPVELVHLWEEIANMNDHETFKWLQDSLHPSIATLELNDSTRLPLAFIDSERKPIPDEEKIISNNCGEGIPDPIKDIFSEESQTTGSDVREGEHDTYPFRESQILFFDDVTHTYDGNFYFRREKDFPVVDVTELEQEKMHVVVTGMIAMVSSVDEFEGVVFYNKENNLQNHKNTGDVLDYEEGIEEILHQCYEKSRDAQDEESEELINWILQMKNKRWNNSILLDETDSDQQMPTLLKLPKQHESIAVILGLDNKRKIQSIARKKFADEKKIVFGIEPGILRWKTDSSDVIYCREHDRFNWIENSSPFNAEGYRQQSLLEKDWNWSQLAPDGETGWIWPQVNLASIENQEDRDAIRLSINPIFIDGFHECQENGMGGIHHGYRIRGSDENEIFDKRDPLNHYSQGTRQTKIDHLRFLDEPISSFPLLKDSIHLHSDFEFTEHSTIQVEEKILLSNEQIHSHGLIRVYGWQIFQLEQNAWDFENRLTREADFLQLQEQLQETRGIPDIAKTKIEIYDVILCKGGTKSRLNPASIGIFAKQIPYEENESNYFSDDNTLRHRHEGSFSHLREERIYGFHKVSDAWFKGPESFIRLFRGTPWLPISEELYHEFSDISEQFLDEIELVPISDQTFLRNILRSKLTNLNRDLPHRDDPDADRWFLRYGFAWLFAKIEDTEAPSDVVDFCLTWLNEALEIGLPRRGWPDCAAQYYILPTIGRQIDNPPRHILTALQIDENYQHIVELLQDRDVHGDWRRFTESCNLAYTPEAREGIREEFSQMLMQVLRDDGDYYFRDFHPSITLNSFRNWTLDYPRVVVVLEEGKLLNKNLIEFDSQGNNSEVFVVDSKQTLAVLQELSNGDNIREVGIFDTIEPHEVALDSDIEIGDCPSHVKFVGELLKQSFETITWFERSDLQSVGVASPGHSSLQISLNEEDNSIRIYIGESREFLSSEEYDILSESILNYVEEQLDQAGRRTFTDAVTRFVRDQNRAVSLPALVRLRYFPEDQNRDIETRRFKEDYCRSELNFTQFEELIGRIESDDDLELTVGSLVDKYRHSDLSLKDSNEILSKWYDSIPAITQGRHPLWEWTGVLDPENSVSVNRNISIDYWMVGSISKSRTINAEFLGRTAGGTLLVNPSEQYYYARSAWGRNEEAYDFDAQVRNKILNEIKRSWYSSHEFIIVEGALISNENMHHGILLHKHHAIHIYAFLTAIGVDADA
jgi:hypothetical protein